MNPLPGYTMGDSNAVEVEVDSFLRTREVLNTELRFYLQKAQARMKKQANTRSEIRISMTVIGCCLSYKPTARAH